MPNEDTPAEAMRREEAYYKMQELIVQGTDPNIARLQIAQEFGIAPYQVKISSGGPEVDVFIPKDIWDSLLPEQRDIIRERLEIFNVDNSPKFTVDFYQDLPLDKMSLGWPDPRTNVPPGSIIFNPDGSIIHQTFASP